MVALDGLFHAVPCVDCRPEAGTRNEVAEARLRSPDSKELRDLFRTPQSPQRGKVTNRSPFHVKESAPGQSEACLIEIRERSRRLLLRPGSL